MSRRAGLFSVAAVSLLLVGCGDRHLSTMDPESPIAEKLDTFLVWLLIVCAVVFVLVQGAVIYMAKRFGVKEPEDESMVYPDEDFPAQTHGNTRLEIGWTIAPTIIMAIVAFFTLGLLFQLDDVSATEHDRRVQSVTVVGQQWWWEFQYDLDGDGQADIVTAGELVLPEDEEVQLHVTSRDVIHSFWIPTLNGKRDAVPGTSNPWTIEAGNQGRFPGECTEFCGLSHAYMEKFVIGLSLEDWDAWAANQVANATFPAEGTDEAAGWTVFEAQCASCHVINGMTSHRSTGVENGVPIIDSWALYDGSLDGANRYIDEQTQVAGAAPNLTHFATRSSFAGGIYDLYSDIDEVVYARAPGEDAADCRDGLRYINLASCGDLNRGALEAWIINAPGEKANAWDATLDGVPRARGMRPFETLSAEDVDNLVAFLMSLD